MRADVEVSPGEGVVGRMRWMLCAVLSVDTLYNTMIYRVPFTI